MSQVHHRGVCPCRCGYSGPLPPEHTGHQESRMWGLQNQVNCQLSSKKSKTRIQIQSNLDRLGFHVHSLNIFKLIKKSLKFTWEQCDTTAMPSSKTTSPKGASPRMQRCEPSIIWLVKLHWKNWCSNQLIVLRFLPLSPSFYVPGHFIIYSEKLTEYFCILYLPKQHFFHFHTCQSPFWAYFGNHSCNFWVFFSDFFLNGQ